MINRHASFTDLHYLNNGDIAKAAKQAGLPFPKSVRTEGISPSLLDYSNTWKNKDLGDLITACCKCEKNDTLVVIDSLGEYISIENKDQS